MQVAGRVGEDGNFMRLADIDVPEDLAKMVCISALPSSILQSLPVILLPAGHGLLWCMLVGAVTVADV